MAQNDNIQLFEDKRIRTAWDEEKEERRTAQSGRDGPAGRHSL